MHLFTCYILLCSYYYSLLIYRKAGNTDYSYDADLHRAVFPKSNFKGQAHCTTVKPATKNLKIKNLLA